MNTITLEYKSSQQLEEFIQSNHLSTQENMLIQVFTAQNNESYIVNLRNNILKFIPEAKIIGTTSSGEISKDGSILNSTVISFSTFNETIIDTKLIKTNTNSFELGQTLMRSFENHLSKEVKLMISFLDGRNNNAEEYLDGITSINPNIIVSGGIAGDNENFEKTFVFNQNDITQNGAVAAVFYNQNLNIYTDYSFNWETIGEKHLVEKSDKNIVSKIGGKSAVEFYSHYLGADLDKFIPTIGIEFPLIIKKDGVSLARAPLAKLDDDSLSFAGNVPQGSTVQFGYGDVQMIIEKGLDNIKQLINEPIESIFVYSCMARKALLGKDINLELLPLKEIAPISGCFTYGEFFHDSQNDHSSNQLLNQTMSLLAISETNTIKQHINPNIFSQNHAQKHNVKLHRTQALASLIKQTTNELEDAKEQLTKKLENATEENIKQDASLQVLKTNAQLGDMIEMIIHQWRQPLSAITTTAGAVQVYSETSTLSPDMLDESLENILSYANNLNTTIEDFRDIFKKDSKNVASNWSSVISKSLNITAPILKTNNIRVIQEITDDPLIFLHTGLMMQVVINIIKNASDILVEKEIEDPIIKFKTSIKKNKLVIKIMDNAGGIPQEILPFIFDKNFTTKNDTHGTGIGLDMSKMIIESKINGTLTASNQGKWAVFKIKIPLH